MYLLYSLILALGFVLALPWFLWKDRSSGKYSRSFRERMGRLPASKPTPIPPIADKSHCACILTQMPNSRTAAAATFVRMATRSPPSERPSEPHVWHPSNSSEATSWRPSYPRSAIYESR